MFVTKKNMADAVEAVSKQLDNVSETLNVSKIGVQSNLCLTQFSGYDFDLTSFMQSTKRHLSKRLESLDWKLEEQKETSLHIANNVFEHYFCFESSAIHRRQWILDTYSGSTVIFFKNLLTKSSLLSETSVVDTSFTLSIVIDFHHFSLLHIS